MATSYVTDSSGTFIPATQRPDGSWRKARRIKEGYVPQEEVPLYESKGKQWAKGRSDYPVGLDLDHLTTSTVQAARPTNSIPGLDLSDADGTKKSKKKKKKKPKSISEESNVNEVTENLGDVSLSGGGDDHDPKGPPSDPAKRLKSLRKKLREIETLEKRIQSGELENPEKEQSDKISRKNEILEQIEDLELEIDEHA